MPEERRKPSPSASSSEYLSTKGGGGGAADPGVQRRKHARFVIKEASPVVKKKVMFAFLNKQDNCAKLLYDLSEGGARVLVTEKLAPGTRLTFELEVKRFNDRFSTPAEVMWCAPYAYKEGQFIVGIRFDDIDSARKRQIEGMRSYFGSPQHRQKEDTKIRTAPPPDWSKVEFDEKNKKE